MAHDLILACAEGVPLMLVYVCVSEQLERGGYYEPPEYGCIAEIVVARNHAQARYLAWKTDRSSLGMVLAEMPRFTVRKIGEQDGPARVLAHNEANPWWAVVPDSVVSP